MAVLQTHQLRASAIESNDESSPQITIQFVVVKTFLTFSLGSVIDFAFNKVKKKLSEVEEKLRKVELLTQTFSTSKKLRKSFKTFFLWSKDSLSSRDENQ